MGTSYTIALPKYKNQTMLKKVRDTLGCASLDLVETKTSRDDLFLMFCENKAALTTGYWFHPNLVSSLVAEGKVDCAIGGSDSLQENDLGASVQLLPIEFGRNTYSGKSSVVLFCTNTAKSLTLQGATVYTEYPALTRQYSDTANLNLQVNTLPGSAEAYVQKWGSFGVALRESGATLQAHNLCERAVIAECENGLLVRRDLYSEKGVYYERMNTLHRALILGASEAALTTGGLAH